MKKEDIQNQAKEIMDNFLQALGDIELSQDFVLEREECFREEREGKVADEDFKMRFLENAPKTRGDALLASKGAWVE